VESARDIFESRFNSIFVHAPMALQIFDVDGTYKYANDGWETHFETSRTKLPGFNLLADPQIAEKGFLPVVHQAIAGQVVRVPAHEYTPAESGKPGRHRWQEAYALPIRSGASREVIQEFALMCVDVTEKVMALNQARQSEEEMAKAIRSRDEFLAAASYELRTPVTSMRLQMQAMNKSIMKGESANVPENVVRALEQTDHSLEKLDSLIGDMLDVSRIQDGKLMLYPKPTDLGEVAREVLDRFSPALVTAGIALNTSLEDGVGGFWDSHRIDQLITNLVTNVIRHAPGSPVSVSVARAGNCAEFRIEDHGRGISAENHERIFDRFERIGSGDRVGGLGLGLFISRQIAESHGGKLELRSVPGSGATFVLTLPLSRVC
jgi:signal transduction histidine kinase